MCVCPPPFRGAPAANQMLRLRQHPPASPGQRAAPARGPAGRFLPAPRDPGAPRHPKTRPGVGKRPRGPTVYQVRGEPRSPGCCHPHRQPAVAPWPEPGTGHEQGTKRGPWGAVPGGTAPHLRCGAWHSPTEGGHPPRAFLRVGIPRAPNSCTSAGPVGKGGPGSDGAGSPEPWDAWSAWPWPQAAGHGAQPRQTLVPMGVPARWIRGSCPCQHPGVSTTVAHPSATTPRHSTVLLRATVVTARGSHEGTVGPPRVHTQAIVPPETPHSTPQNNWQHIDPGGLLQALENHLVPQFPQLRCGGGPRPRGAALPPRQRAGVPAGSAAPAPHGQPHRAQPSRSRLWGN